MTGQPGVCPGCPTNEDLSMPMHAGLREQWWYVYVPHHTEHYTAVVPPSCAELLQTDAYVPFGGQVSVYSAGTVPDSLSRGESYQLVVMSSERRVRLYGRAGSALWEGRGRTVMPYIQRATPRFDLAFQAAFKRYAQCSVYDPLMKEYFWYGRKH